MSNIFVVDAFDDPTKWLDLTIGAGTIPTKAPDFFLASLNAIGDMVGLISTSPHDLTSSNLRVKADRRGAAQTYLLIRSVQSFDNPIPDEVEYYWAIIRDSRYGIIVYDGFGVPYLAPDPVPPEQTAELRIAIVSGVITFFYEGAQIYSTANLRIDPSFLYVYLLTVATTTETILGTSAFQSISYVPVLTVTVAPPTATLQVGQNQTFTSTVSGGLPPYMTNWIDNVTKTVLGSGDTFTFNAVAAGNYEMFAEVTDNVGSVATSPIVPITVTQGPVAPRHRLSGVSDPAGFIPITIERL